MFYLETLVVPNFSNILGSFIVHIVESFIDMSFIRIRELHHIWCMIKIFRGGKVVTPSKPPPPYEQLLPLPTPCFKKFLERSLNDPHPPPPNFKHLSLLPPSPSTTPSPPKNFDHTLGKYRHEVSTYVFKYPVDGKNPKSCRHKIVIQAQLSENDFKC